MNSTDIVNSSRVEQINAKAEEKMRLLLGNKYEAYQKYERRFSTRSNVNR